MIFCSECFKDTEVKAIIDGLAQTGNCQVCGKKQITVYDTNKNIELVEYFEELISIYSPSRLLPEEFPKSEVDLLKNELIVRWNIFNNIPTAAVHNIITSICSEKYEGSPGLFDEPIGIAEIHDKDYVFERSLLRDK